MRKAVVLLIAGFLIVGILSAEEDLTLQTLPIDIATSDYYELEAWCERLGLNSGGTRRELERRLREYYGLGAAPAAEQAEQSSGITIESAYNLEYFTMDVVEEKYIRLTGGVILTLKDREDDASHRIKADTIVFNQDTASLTAGGNIEYILTRDGKDEVFHGDSLTFDTENWEGVFFEGISEREREMEGGKVTFYYSGHSMYRSRDNVVTLKDGVITSSEHLPPNYSIRASRIWVLAPGEWAIANAVLYIGRIPVFYFPAFFRPGDRLFFNPSLGYRSREGYFVQTTTYLLGDRPREDEDTTISFLQTVGTENIDRTVQGLFLRESDVLPPLQRRIREYADKTESYIKLLLDVYSRLGYLAGIEGSLEDLGILKTFNFSTALGRSREIFETPEGYTPVYQDTDGTFTSSWDQSYLLFQRLPFRYAIDLDFSLRSKFFSLSGQIPAYSDPYFEQDFFDRKERINWSELLGIGAGEGETTPAAVTQSSVWNLKSSLTLPVDGLKPYVNNLGIKKLESSMYWKSRQMESDEEEEAGYFFYPDSMVLPDFSGNLRGVLFSTSGTGGRAEGADAEVEKGTPGAEIRSPWDAAPEEDNEDPGKTIPRSPEYRPDITLEGLRDVLPFSHSLSYDVTPDVSFNTKLDSDDWTNPADIVYTPQYSLLVGKGNLSATYNAEVYKNLLNLRLVQNLTGQIKQHSNLGAGLSEDQAESYERQDLEGTYLRLNEAFTLTARPFTFNELLRDSSIGYSLKAGAYEIKHDEATGEFREFFLTWSEDCIQEHTISLDMAYKPAGVSNTFSIRYQLPPLAEDLNLAAALQTGPLTTTIRWSAAEEENDDGSAALMPDPFILRERLEFLQSSFFEQELRYDFEEKGFSESLSRMEFSLFDGKLALNQAVSYSFLTPGFSELTTALDLWPLELSFSMKDTYEYTFDMSDGWIRSAETSFIPHQAGFSLNQDIDIPPLWKNRVLITSRVSSSWQMNIQRFTDNIFTFDFNLGVKIAEFLDLTFKTRSENTATHLYVPVFMEGLGRHISPIEDLIKSFNFFDIDDRKESHFNVKSISLELIHKLEDWDLSLSYNGKPELNETNQYDLKTTFTVLVQWNPIPELEKELEIDKDGTISF